MTNPAGGRGHRLFIERLIIAIAIIAIALLLWALRGLLILVFGAALVAVILRIIANPIERRLHLPGGIALLLAVLMVLGILAIAFWLFGAEVVNQASVLKEAVPQAWQAVQARLEAWGMGEALTSWQDQFDGDSVLSRVSSVLMSVGNALTDTLLVLVGGVFLAANPDLYRAGITKLVPEGGRDLARQAMTDLWNGLRLWLLGRLISMVIVGLLTGFGLWLIGIPGALALAVVAFILEFIPFLGPIIAAFPAVLLALALDPTLALWTALLYLVIQQIEGNVVAPLVQQHAVDLPPALLLFSLVAAALIFGIVGILFAEPLTVVLFILVKRLYVREALHTQTPMPGDGKD